MSFSFRAMSTDVRVVALGSDEAATAALERRITELFAEAERRFSRFRADSELSQLNRAEGPVAVSRALFDALVRARAYAELTRGLFDPTIGSSLAALGYDRSFEPRGLDRDQRPSPAGASGAQSARRTRFFDVALDEATCTVVRPAGVSLDFGGFIKGHTVDAAATLLAGAGAVDAGGDAVLRGNRPTGWLVDVEDPTDARRVVTTLRVFDRAVATSAPNRRQWRVGAEVHHHLIDPRTGRSARSDLAQVTVLAPTAERADVLAKVTFIAGAREGRRFLEALPDVSAVLVRSDGVLETVGALEIVSDA